MNRLERKHCHVEYSIGFDMEGDANIRFRVLENDELEHIRYLTENEIQEEVLSRLERVLMIADDASVAEDVEWLKMCFFKEGNLETR